MFMAKIEPIALFANQIIIDLIFYLCLREMQINFDLMIDLGLLQHD
jgi:hypothetical protein